MPQTIFLTELGVNFRRYLPDALLPRCYPVRAMIDAGLIVALSSDAPVVVEESPLAGLEAALTRLDAEGFAIAPEQAITAAEGLYAYTVGGALAAGDGDRGRIAPGLLADAVVLERDPLAVPAREVGAIPVSITILDGSIVFER